MVSLSLTKKDRRGGGDCRLRTAPFDGAFLFHVFSDSYDESLGLQDREFLNFARKALQANSWNAMLCHWLECAITLIEENGQEIIRAGRMSKRPLEEWQMWFRMNNVYRSLHLFVILSVALLNRSEVGIRKS